MRRTPAQKKEDEATTRLVQVDAKLKDEATDLLEEWLLFAQGSLDEKQVKWLFERTRTMIAIL